MPVPAPPTLQDYTGRVAIVTGAARGLGRAVAERLHERGGSVAINVRDAERAERVAREIGERAFAVPGDVAAPDAPDDIVRRTIERFERIDILINNAGVHFVKDITEMTVQEWDRLMDINLKSMFLCCKHVIPHMLKQHQGSIVNLASISSFIGQEMNGASTFAYNVTKAGALQLTKSLATRYASDGIRVNCVCPGNVETNILKRATPDEVAEFWRDASRSEPIGRNAQPAEIANAILFLASDESSFVTGSPLIIDGGYLAR